MKRLWLGCCMCLLLAGACAEGQRPVSASAFDHLQIAGTMHSYHTPSQMGQITSMAQDESGRVLLCDHSNLYVMANAGTGYAISPVPKPAVPVWQPTGLAYAYGHLYVANGPGHDLLVFRPGTMQLLLRVTSPQMTSPQAVTVEADGAMVVADQIGGGGAVLKFAPSGRLLWRTRLAGAHGLVEAAGAIYATSVQTQTISRLTLQGRIVETTGKAGVSLGRFLRPVGLAAANGLTQRALLPVPVGGVAGDDLGGVDLIVTDAYSGRITVLDGYLRLVQQVGGIGPGIDAFNFPTVTLPISDGYLIADGYRQRIVHTDARWVVLDQVATGPTVPAGRRLPLVFGSDARPYTYRMLPGVDVPAALGLRSPETFVGGFDGLDEAGGDAAPSHLTFEDSQFGGTGVTWAELVGPYVVVGSPTDERLEVIDPSTGMFTYVTVGDDTWPSLDSLLVAGSVRRPLRDVIAPAVAVFGRATQLRGQGLSPEDALDEAVSPAAPRDWAADLVSPAGRQFLQSGMTGRDASQYYASALGQRDIRVVELLEVKYLSGGA